VRNFTIHKIELHGWTPFLNPKIIFFQLDYFVAIATKQLFGINIMGCIHKTFYTLNFQYFGWDALLKSGEVPLSR